MVEVKMIQLKIAWENSKEGKLHGKNAKQAAMRFDHPLLEAVGTGSSKKGAWEKGPPGGKRASLSGIDEIEGLAICKSVELENLS